MHELVQQIIEKTGVSQEQANMAIGVIKQFVSQKAPMISGPLDQILGGETTQSGEHATNPLQDGLGAITGKLGGFFGS